MQNEIIIRKKDYLVDLRGNDILNKVKPIENYKHICFMCLNKKTDIHTYSISGRGYGSDFDSFNSELQLCSECTPKDIDVWFAETPEIKDGFFEIYKYEENILSFIEALPLQGQELFYNRLACEAGAYKMNSQDWIDEKLGILSDEAYENYGMYSPRQIKAYKKRFPTCEHPVNVVYSDQSKGCWCPFGAYGEYGQEVGSNISEECFGCSHYKKRESPIKEMDSNTYGKYEQYIRGIQYENIFK
ncbi:hypothetical protein NST17_20105 [Caldifermentibacillus hisashii]|uniref:Uncharacterized protein n=1 Tax=Caldifermentibacillus hisashii TaxID=996558 RepID=A0ABU9K2U1_9BACI